MTESLSEDQTPEVPALEPEAIESFTEPIGRHDDPEEGEA